MKKGFTLIELLVVIAILAILAVIGFTVFNGISKNARDAKRKQDIDALFKAYETKYTNLGAYEALAPSDFAGGEIPKDPDSARGEYFIAMEDDGKWVKVCAALEVSTNPCNTQSAACYCRRSAQGTIDAADPYTTNYAGWSVGEGGSSPPPSVPPSAPPSSPPSPSPSPASCHPNLAGYWKFDEGSGTAVADSSGNGQNGSFTGPGTHWAAGKAGLGNAGQFNGSGDYVTTSTWSNLNITNNLTVAAWVWINPWPLGCPSNYPTIVNKDHAYYLGLRCTGEEVSNGFFLVNPEPPNNVSENRQWGPDPPTSQWYHMVMTYDKDENGGSNNWKYYQDGAYNKADSKTWLINNDDNPLNIGIGNFIGLIDEVRIYNRVLSGPEISALKNSGPGCDLP